MTLGPAYPATPNLPGFLNPAYGNGIGAYGRADDSFFNYSFKSDLVDSSAHGNVATIVRNSTKTIIPESSLVAVADVAINTAGFPGSGVLIEPSHENKNTQSRNAASPDWSLVVGTATNDGTAMADDSTTGNNLITDTVAGSLTLNQTHTVTSGEKFYISVFTEHNNLQYQVFSILNAGNRGRAWFDVTDGTLASTGTLGSNVTPIAAEIAAVKNGGYYTWLSVGTVGFTTLIDAYRMSNTDGANTSPAGSKIYFFQHDFVEGFDHALSPVTTITTTASCLADTITIDSSNVTVNDFDIPLTYKPNGINDSVVLYSQRDANDGFELIYDGADFVLTKYVGGVTHTTSQTTVLTRSDEYALVMEFRSDTGFKIHVDAAVSGNANTEDIIVMPTAKVGCDFNSLNHISGQILELSGGPA